MKINEFYNNLSSNSQMLILNDEDKQILCQWLNKVPPDHGNIILLMIIYHYLYENNLISSNNNEVLDFNTPEIINILAEFTTEVRGKKYKLPYLGKTMIGPKAPRFVLENIPDTLVKILKSYQNMVN